MTPLNALLLCLHLLSAALWVGGMAVMLTAVRPAAVATLEPPLRLPFMAAALGRFFRGVDVAITLLLVTGVGMVYLAGGMRAVHWSVHAMLGLGVVMMLLYGHLRGAMHPALVRAIATREWPVAGAKLNAIRQRVAINLLLGIAVFAVAIVGRAF